MFENTSKNCLILEKKIETITSYNTKSAGYSFGSDLSKEELITKNIKSNIDMFFNDISLSNVKYNCNNEN